MWPADKCSLITSSILGCLSVKASFDDHGLYVSISRLLTVALRVVSPVPLDGSPLHNHRHITL